MNLVKLQYVYCSVLTFFSSFVKVLVAELAVFYLVTMTNKEKKIFIRVESNSLVPLRHVCFKIESCLHVQIRIRRWKFFYSPHPPGASREEL